MRRFIFGGLFILLISMLTFAGEEPSVKTIVEKVSQQVYRNLQAGRVYGQNQRVVMSRLDNDGSVRSIDEKFYQTVWVEGQPFNRLVRCGNRSLTKTEELQEQKRQIDFASAVRKKQKATGFQAELKAIQWGKVADKYDFSLLPPTEGAAYVLAFRPKNQKLTESSHIERVLNHLSGTVWIDRDYNVMRAEARLLSPVAFGLGLFAKIDQADIDYSQASTNDVWLPSTLHVQWKATVALLKKDHRDMRVWWHEPFLNPSESVTRSAGR